MKRPNGWVYFLPLGAVSSTARSAILNAVLLNALVDGLGRVNLVLMVEDKARVLERGDIRGFVCSTMCVLM